MALSREIVNFWKKTPLGDIIPDRNGAEYPDGEAILDELVKRVGPGRVTEFGCGRGRLSPFFDPERYIGVDISPVAVKKAKQDHPEHKFQVIKVNQGLPKADTVFAYTVLHHIPDDMLQDAIERLCDAADRVVVAEVMDSRFRHQKMPPCLNRELSEYEYLFGLCGFQNTWSRRMKYAAYSDRLMTMVVFERK